MLPEHLPIPKDKIAWLETKLKYPEDSRVIAEVKFVRNNVHLLLILALDYLGLSLANVRECSLLGTSDSISSATVYVLLGLSGHRDEIVFIFSPESQNQNELAISQWRHNQIPTPEVLLNCELYLDHVSKPVFCHAYKVIRDDRNNIARNGYEHLDECLTNNHPDEIYGFGCLVGLYMRQMSLQLLPTDVLFGGRGLPLSTSFATMADGLVASHFNQFLQLGFTEDILRNFIQQCQQHFQANLERIYAHNDLAPHNVLVVEKKPLKISIIDPNTIVTHPCWDFATAMNRQQLIADQLARAPHSNWNIFRDNRERTYFAGLQAGWSVENDPEIMTQTQLVRIVQLLWKLAQDFGEGNMRPNDQIQLNAQLRVHLAITLLRNLVS